MKECCRPCRCHHEYDSDGDVENVVTERHTNEWQTEGWTMVNRPQHKLTWSKDPGKLTTEYLQDGCCDGNRGYRNKMVLAILILHVAPIPSFGSIWLTIREQMRFEDFQESQLGGHLKISERFLQFWIFMSLIKFWLNQHYDLGGNVIWRISRRLPWQPSWMSEWNKFSSSESSCLPNASNQVSALSDLPFESRCRFKTFKLPIKGPSWILEWNKFSNSKSHCHPNASHKVWAQSDLPFGSRGFEEFQDDHCGGLLEYLNGTNLAVLNLHVSQMPPIKLQHYQIYRSRADVVSRFSSWSPWQPSWILEQNEFSNSNSPCHPNASHKVWAQSYLLFGSRHVWRFSRWPPWQPNERAKLWREYRNGTILAILNLYVAPMPPIKCQLNPTWQPS